MGQQDTHLGYTVINRSQPLVRGTDEYNLATDAIKQWRKAAYQSGQNTKQCLNAAREIEIERDQGVSIAINARC